MNGLSTKSAQGGVPDISRVQGAQRVAAILGKLPYAKSEADQATLQKELMEVATSLSQPSSYGGCGCPDPETILCNPTERDHRRPVVVEVRTSDELTIANGELVIDRLLTDGSGGIFQAISGISDARKIFLPNDANLRPQTHNRALVGLGFKFILAAHVDDATDTVRRLSSEELQPYKDALMQCQIQVFRSSSKEPWIDTVPMSYFGEKGALFPASLRHGAAFVDEQAHVLITDPVANVGIAEVISANTLQVKAQLQITGLFVDPAIAKELGYAFIGA